MKQYRLEAIVNIMNGCTNNDYKSICKAGRLIENGYTIDCDPNMIRKYKSSLYRKFMRAYTRYVLSNPNCIKDIASDCCFNQFENGENVGIWEPLK